jgi:hypothetical protein
MRALGGDSKTQDGINCHVGIIDEYHAHKDDTVKENLESSTVQRTQALFITSLRLVPMCNRLASDMRNRLSRCSKAAISITHFG